MITNITILIGIIMIISSIIIFRLSRKEKKSAERIIKTYLEIKARDRYPFIIKRIIIKDGKLVILDPDVSNLNKIGGLILNDNNFYRQIDLRFDPIDGKITINPYNLIRKDEVKNKKL